MGKRNKGLHKNSKISSFKWLRRDWQIYMLALPGMLFFAIFSYLPLYGLQVAFKDYNVAKGIWGSAWVGFDNFIGFFKTPYFWRTTYNTLFLNFLFIITVQILGVLTSLLLNEVRGRITKRIYQSIIFVPYFLSWVIISAITYNLFDEQFGTLNNILANLGHNRVMWNAEPKLWVVILVIANLWRSIGFQTIIYLAGITSISPDIYESARIDGSNRLQEMLYITIPQLTPTIVTMVILAIGKIFYGNFDMIFSLVGNNGLLYSTTDVIDTFVYRTLAVSGDTGTAAAVGLYQSVLGLILVVVTNKVSKKLFDDTGLF